MDKNPKRGECIMVLAELGMVIGILNFQRLINYLSRVLVELRAKK